MITVLAMHASLLFDCPMMPSAPGAEVYQRLGIAQLPKSNDHQDKPLSMVLPANAA